MPRTTLFPSFIRTVPSIHKPPLPPRKSLCTRASPTPRASLPSLRVIQLTAPVRYQTAWRWQQTLTRTLRQNPSAPDVLLLLEHPPVYTLGSSSKLDYVLFDAHELQPTDDAPSTSSPDLVRTERGGEVTYHGPGQLVAYPLLNLARHKRDLHWYLRKLEESVIGLLAGYGVEAGRCEGLTGVWVGRRKIAAMGLKVSRWVTMHGLSLNVDVDLAPFERIVPCGIQEEGRGVCSLKQLGVDEFGVKERYVEAFCEVFGPYDVERIVVGEDAVEKICEVEDREAVKGVKL